MPASVPAAAEPIGASAFARAMAALGPFEPAPHLALAVSGGADSLSLALLAADWLAARGGRGTVLTVDHGLRPAAAAEAQWVAAAAARLGFDHRTLLWRPAGAGAVTQARARAARYRLLEAAAAEAGCLHLLLGHHRDDNAQTIAMRRARAPGPGLAGMPAVRELDRVRLLRPLLGFARARLRATAARLGYGWIEDPSNVDPRFERARTASGPVAVASAEREALEAAARRWLARRVRRGRKGELRLDGAAFDAAPPALAAELLARTTAAVGGTGSVAGRGRVEAAARRLRTDRSALTLAGAMVGREGADLVVTPERATSAPRADDGTAAPPLAGAPFAPAPVVTDAGILIC